jgi:hypothetical protein
VARRYGDWRTRSCGICGLVTIRDIGLIVEAISVLEDGRGKRRKWRGDVAM